MKAHFILYVLDQARSTAFYTEVLAMQPSLNVTGMTEFELAADVVLGLMPRAGAVRLLGEEIVKDPSGVTGAEVYLVVSDPAAYHSRSLSAGSLELSPLADRDWGHTAAYSLDPDGHVLAFATATNNKKL